MERQPRILAVDDDPSVLDLLYQQLREGGYRVVLSRDGDDALAKLSRHRFDLVISDIRMPGRNGLELLDEIKSRDPLQPVILVTSVMAVETAVRALRLGADDYLLKPFGIDALNGSVGRALERARRQLSSRRYRESLEAAVEKKTSELRTALGRMHDTFDATVEAMVSAIEARDIETQHHCRRARDYALLLSESFDLAEQDLRDIGWGSLLHDAGKIGVRDEILLKRGPLDEVEWDEMRKHPVIGYRLLAPIEFLRGAARIVLHHHEHWDGSGYPFGKSGESIPRGARIFAVADAYETITSRRSYKVAYTYERARAEIVEGAGSHFDPRVVEAFLRIPPERWTAIRKRYESMRSPIESPLTAP